MRAETFLRQQDGAVAVEFAFVVPVLLVLLFAGYEGTRIATASMRLNDSAQMMADLVSRQTYVTAAQMSDFCDGIKLAMNPLSTASYRATVASVTHTASGVVVDWQDTKCGSGNAIASAATLAKPYIPSVNDTVIIVQAAYDYRPVVNSVVSPAVTLVRTGYARSRGGTPVSHY